MLKYGINTCVLVVFATSAKMYTHEYKYFHSTQGYEMEIIISPGREFQVNKLP